MGCCSNSGGQIEKPPAGGIAKKKIAGAPDLGYWKIRGFAQSIRY